jgi:SAM-dependent methyltransferase
VAEACLVRAFDLEAEGYDRDFGANPIGRVFRHAVQERLLALFPAGSRVIDLGCGTGEDAVLLAARGVELTGVDSSPEMVSRARAKASQAGLRCVFECADMERLGDLGGPFDGAFSNFGAVNCADLRAVGEGLARVLRPGAPVLLNLLGPRPWPATALGALRGRPSSRAAGAPRVQGVPVPVQYPTLAAARKRLGTAFTWHGAWALGVLVPDPSHAAWAARHPVLFGSLSALEGVIRKWPLVRGGGDHVVLEGARRAC